MHLTISNKLVIAFGVVILLTAVSAIVAYVRIDHLTRQSMPVQMACNQIMTGVQRSLASLHGYMILDRASFARRWQQAWREIDEQVQQINDQQEDAFVRNDRNTWREIQRRHDGDTDGYLG